MLQSPLYVKGTLALLLPEASHNSELILKGLTVLSTSNLTPTVRAAFGINEWQDLETPSETRESLTWCLLISCKDRILRSMCRSHTVRSGQWDTS